MRPVIRFPGGLPVIDTLGRIRVAETQPANCCCGTPLVWDCGDYDWTDSCRIDPSLSGSLPTKLTLNVPTLAACPNGTTRGPIVDACMLLSEVSFMGRSYYVYKPDPLVATFFIYPTGLLGDTGLEIFWGDIDGQYFVHCESSPWCNPSPNTLYSFANDITSCSGSGSCNGGSYYKLNYGGTITVQTPPE